MSAGTIPMMPRVSTARRRNIAIRDLHRLYNSTSGSLPIVIICHAAIDTAGRYMLPEFSNGGYQVVWWFMVGLYAVIAVIVVLVAGPKRLITRIPRPSASD
jgi:hypothetical protein